MGERRGTRGWWAAAAVAAAAVAAAGGWGAYHGLRPAPETDLRPAQTALDRGQYAVAERAAREALVARPDWATARLLAARAAALDGRLEAALAYLDEWPGGDAGVTSEGRNLAVEVLLALGRAGEAERRLQQALAASPADVESRHHLVRLLTLQGRRWETAPHLFALLKQQTITLDELLLLGDLWFNYDSEDKMRLFRSAVPEDPVPLLAAARTALRFQRTAQAEVLLRQVVNSQPDLLEAQAWLGMALVQSGQDTACATWHRALPAGADAHPLIWLVRGLWAQRQGQREAAIRCYVEAARREPNYALAFQRLAHSLALEAHPLAPLVAEREQRLVALRYRLYRLQTDQAKGQTTPQKDQLVHEVIRSLTELGRPWEAHAWCQVLIRSTPDADAELVRSAQSTADRLDQVLASQPPQTLSAANPAWTIDPQQYPLPDFDALGSAEPSSAPSAGPAPEVRLVDAAADLGIRFVYDNGERPNAARYIHEANGGGVAVLDYDADGWPDLYFTQGGRFPPDADYPRSLDAMYRNIDGQRFVEVAERARVADDAYGQGVAAGDYDGDGFTDLLVANLGGSRLLRNNGDGTFRDCTAIAGLDPTGWSTSCTLADLTGDGLPDVYAANYAAEVPGIWRRVCESAGRSVTCGPHHFPAEPDRFYVNLGDGRFAEQLAAAGMEAPNGFGLGLLAANLDGTGRLGLFVANDQTPNFYFANVTQPGGPPRFEERAAATGLAVDGYGAAEACMGVAADDANGDGLLDLFVTNYYEETNTLYLQLRAGTLWEDGTDAAGLGEPSLPMVGWGTQFFDVDLDGWPDLIAANGHVEKFAVNGAPERMRTQFFYNTGGGRFVELGADLAGEFFARPLLGRGLARWDFNRDGREETVQSNMNDPAAVLVNQTQPRGHFLAVRLVGVASCRDAIGTVLRAKVGGRTIVKQLTAGDGYQASNQRQIVFGLGSADRVERLAVRWPSGREDVFLDVPGDRCVLLVEGAAGPAVLWRGD